VVVDIVGCGGGRHERHVVERRQQDAAIHGVKVHEAFEREVHGRRGLRFRSWVRWD